MLPRGTFREVTVMERLSHCGAPEGEAKDTAAVPSQRKLPSRRSSRSKCMELRPLIRRKKLKRCKHPSSFVGPCSAFSPCYEVGLSLLLPLTCNVAIAPADPHDVTPALRILNHPHDISRATNLA